MRFPGSGSGSAPSVADLPPDIQEIILGMVLADAPLAQLAGLATLCKAMRAAYRERLTERLACIQERLKQRRSKCWRAMGPRLVAVCCSGTNG
jgi:hypothetical protein